MKQLMVPLLAFSITVNKPTDPAIAPIFGAIAHRLHWSYRVSARQAGDRLYGDEMIHGNAGKV